MLSLSAGHLHALRSQNPEKTLIWVDIGGGTGMYRFVTFTTLVVALTRGRRS